MGYVIAFIVGAWFGIVLMALAVAAGRANDGSNEGVQKEVRDGAESMGKGE